MLDRIIRWRSLQAPGLEHFRITQMPDAIHAHSILLGEHDGRPFGVHYTAMLSPNWVFRSLDVERDDGQTLALTRDDEGRWTCNGVDRPDLAGCVDIDISGSPFTNSLPIRREMLAPYEPTRFVMAFVPLDSLAPFPDGQVYTDLGHGKYRYQAEDRSFSAEIQFDEDRLVVSYPPLFERI